jgi:hypothetical protein
MKDSKKIDGLNVRHVAQIIRRNMITKIKPSGKTYSRRKFKVSVED